MGIRFIDRIQDFRKNETRNFRFHQLAAAPASPVTGQAYYDTAVNKLFWWNGTSWVDATGGAITFGAVTAQTSFGLVSGNGSATTAARSDHTHGTPSLPYGVVTAQTSGFGLGSADGVSTNLSRADHVHGTPALPYGAVTSQTAFGAASSSGVSTSLSRTDHVHGTPTHDAAAHSTIPLSALAAATAAVNVGSQRLTAVANASAATDAVNLQQVQDLINTGSNKTAVRAASTANISVTGGLIAGAALDGVTLAAGNRVLLKDQTAGAENGLWIVPASGNATRATDADISAEVTGGLAVWINEGTVNGDTRWVLTTNDTITLGTTALTFVQDFKATSTTAAAGLVVSGNGLAVGAGTGIVVNPDSVQVDTAVVSRKLQGTIGDGTATSFTITHNFNNANIELNLADNSAGDDYDPNVTSRTANAITFSLSVAPSANQLSYTIFG